MSLVDTFTESYPQSPPPQGTGMSTEEYIARCYFHALDMAHNYTPVIKAASLCLAFLDKKEDYLGSATEEDAEENILTEFVIQSIDRFIAREDDEQQRRQATPNSHGFRELTVNDLAVGDLISFVLTARTIKRGGQGVYDITFSPVLFHSTIFNAEDREVMREIHRNKKSISDLPSIVELDELGYEYVVGTRSNSSEGSFEEDGTELISA